jgi:hypothetical protein
MDLSELVEKRFLNLANEYADRKNIAESLVSSWHWATVPVWDLNTLYFEMNSESPGRELKEKPSGKDEFFSYGTDASGRIVVEVEHSATRAGNKEKFYDWSKNPVEVVYFNDDRKKRPINMKLAKYVDDRIVQIATAASGGSSLETYSWNESHVMQIEILHGERTQKGLEKLTGYKIVRATYTASGVVQCVEVDWLPRLLSGRVARTQAVSPMVQAVQTQVVFERRRPKSEPDGEYSHFDFARLTRSGWLAAVQLVCDGDAAPVTLLDGTTRQCVDEELEKTIGEFLVSVLVSARNDGVFADLPRATRCELGVEEGMNGTFGWPHYEDRGKENLL